MSGCCMLAYVNIQEVHRCIKRRCALQIEPDAFTVKTVEKLLRDFLQAQFADVFVIVQIKPQVNLLSCVLFEGIKAFLSFSIVAVGLEVHSQYCSDLILHRRKHTQSL